MDGKHVNPTPRSKIERELIFQKSPGPQEVGPFYLAHLHISGDRLIP